MKRQATAILLGAALSLAAGQASAEKLILKFGHVGNPGSLFEASVDEFVKNANARLGDRAEVQAFGSSQLGKDKELLQKLKLGQIMFALPPPSCRRWPMSSVSSKCPTSCSLANT